MRLARNDSTESWGFYVTAELQAAEAAALQPVPDRVRRQLGLGGKRLGAPALGFARGTITQAEGRLVVPPTPHIRGSAVDDLVTQIGMLEADADELHQVLGLDPDRQPPLVDRLVVDVADPDRQHPQAELVGIERAERLAERLAHGVARIRPQDRRGVEAAVARIEAEHMVGRSEDDARDAGLARRLEEIVGADDVGGQDLLPRALDRDAAEMNDSLHARDGALDGGRIREIGGDEVLV